MNVVSKLRFCQLVTVRQADVRALPDHEADVSQNENGSNSKLEILRFVLTAPPAAYEAGRASNRGALELPGRSSGRPPESLEIKV